MATPTFELITELQATIRRDFPVAATAILNPLGTGTAYNTLPLIEGEWLELDTNYALTRKSSGVSTNGATFPVHTEKGRYDVGAIQKVNVIFAGMYEAETAIFTSTSIDVGDPLMVTDVSYGGVTRRGLAVDDNTTDLRVVVGICTKIVTGRLRFLHFANTIAVAS